MSTFLCIYSLEAVGGCAIPNEGETVPKKDNILDRLLPLHLTTAPTLTFTRSNWVLLLFLLRWPKSPCSCFCKIIHFSLSPITLLIWRFSVCWLSPTWCSIDCSQLMSPFDHYQLQLVYPTRKHRPARNLLHEISQTTFDTFNQLQPLLYTLHKSFFVFQLHFYHSWNDKA